jgi:glycosyltransferase involved in cell wall biosynthesis
LENNMKKRFSVLVPVYNREDCIQQTVDSVLAQTFTDYELIVIDDGSNDGTTDLLRSYGNRIKFIQQANQGPEVARNTGASQANGEYLALLDSDDLFLPSALATYDKVIRAFDSPAVIIGAMKYFQSGQDIPSYDNFDTIEVLKYRDYLSKEVGFGISSSKIVIRKSVFDQAGGLRMTTPKTFHCDDFNLLLRTATSGPFIVVVQPTTVAYRMHTTNAIHNLDAMVRGVLGLIRHEHQGEYPGGRARQLERYARIGGAAQSWARHSIQGGRPGLAFKLLRSAWPMIMVSAAQKVWQGLHRPIKSICLP